MLTLLFGCASDKVKSSDGVSPPLPFQSTFNNQNHSALGVSGEEQKLFNIPSPLDGRMAWDAFQHRGSIVWMCRGVTTGNFVDRSYCASEPRTDSQWPGKEIPAHWTGKIF